MSKKDEFKEFASNNKYLFNAVNKGETTWQKLYETYDIYGSDSSIWDTFKTKESKNKTEAVKTFISNLKNIDTDKLEENVSSLQKALDFLEEIVLMKDTKKEEKKTTSKKNSPTNIERFFDD